MTAPITDATIQEQPKNCPFCGNTARIIRTTTKPVMFSVECGLTSCIANGIQKAYPTKASAVEKWNVRRSRETLSICPYCLELPKTHYDTLVQQYKVYCNCNASFTVGKAMIVAGAFEDVVRASWNNMCEKEGRFPL